MSEMLINLPDGAPAVVSGLPEQQARVAQTIVTTHESHTIDGHPEWNLTTPDVLVGLPVALVAIGGLIWLNNRYRTHSMRALHNQPTVDKQE